MNKPRDFWISKSFSEDVIFTGPPRECDKEAGDWVHVTELPPGSLVVTREILAIAISKAMIQSGSSSLTFIDSLAELLGLDSKEST